MEKKSSNANLGSIRSGRPVDYFSWLCLKIDRRQKYESRELAMLLNTIKFRPLIPNDDNRVEDGLTLREHYCQETNQSYDCMMENPCTVFEMLIALAEKIEDIMRTPGEDQTAKWFWEMIDNLGLRGVDNPIKCRRMVQNFIDRDYSENGKGGLFPLKSPPKDQRVVEIWYQMMAYLQEKYPE